jgi:Tol biopolymer transport system component
VPGGGPAWSPDGLKIAFARGRDYDREDIYVISADGGNQRRLTRNQAGNDDPAWSPDGRLIAFASARSGNGDIYVMNADGSHQRRLMRGRSIDFDPAWSPHA